MTDALTALDNFYWDQEEPNRGCFLALKEIILGLDEGMTPEWKYKLPFFYLNGKMFCYLWKDKKTKIPYIGIMGGYKLEHPSLIQEGRKFVKLLHVDPNKDLDIELISEIMEMTLEMHRKGAPAFNKSTK